MSHDQSEMEIWRDIPGFSGCQVSSQGRVREYWKKLNPGRGHGPLRVSSEVPRFTKIHVNPRGYLYVRLRDQDSTVRNLQVHRIVLTAFVGECPNGMEGCHKDGSRTNAKLDNLYWGTRKQNCMDTSRHGRNRNRKLSESQKSEILELRRQGWTLSKLGERFGVHLATISKTVQKLRDAS